MKEYLEKSMSYVDYEKLIDDLLAEGKTTGSNQSETLFGYAKLNRQRMRRLGKTIELSENIREAVQSTGRSMTWLIITEGWCGDAAQNIPVIEKIAAQSDKIETRYILRDENPDLIDRFLTGGARSIPKLIALDTKTFDVVGLWGPRPSAAQRVFAEMKKNGAEKAAILEEMQRWYNADKGQSLQNEVASLLSAWDGRLAAAAGK